MGSIFFNTDHFINWIRKTKDFFKSLGVAQTLSEVGVEDKRLQDMARGATAFGEIGSFKKLKTKDVLNILKAAF